MISPKIPDKFSAKFNLHFYDRNFIRGFYKQKVIDILRGSGYKNLSANFTRIEFLI